MLVGMLIALTIVPAQIPDENSIKISLALNVALRARIASRNESKRGSVKPLVKAGEKNCPCSTMCTCGCNEGDDCICGNNGRMGNSPSAPLILVPMSDPWNQGWSSSVKEYRLGGEASPIFFPGNLDGNRGRWNYPQVNRYQDQSRNCET